HAALRGVLMGRSRLPTPCALARPAPSSASSAPKRRRAVSEGRPFVLNVNGEEANPFMVTRVLEPAGYNVVEADSGMEALLLARQRPQLIVLDVNLLDISGLEVCRRFKAQGGTRTIPIPQNSATFHSAGRRGEGPPSG